MMRDILIDVNAAKNFCNPLDPEYKALLKWLKSEGALVVTKALLVRYVASTGASCSLTNVVAIVAFLQAAGRLNQVSKTQLRAFQFPRSFEPGSNREDHDLIKAVMLSYRRLALTLDHKFHDDVNACP